MGIFNKKPKKEELKEKPNQMILGRKCCLSKYAREILFTTDKLSNQFSVMEHINQNPKHPFMKELQFHVHNPTCQYVDLSHKQLKVLRDIIDDKLKRNKNPSKFIDIDKLRYRKGLCNHLKCSNEREHNSIFCGNCVQMHTDECNYCSKSDDS